MAEQAVELAAWAADIAAKSAAFSRRSASSGNQLLISLAQSASLIGGPPGVIPAASAGRQVLPDGLAVHPQRGAKPAL
ncbi:hypothetical protein KCMC57_up63110 [Kitasatospora sp. CMC57]|uniref:Transposase n=1 Tax=Kitasatospora sp. CMC57 TaxID=3231513 RepID=A0AB33K8X2_9ACTN